MRGILNSSYMWAGYINAGLSSLSTYNRGSLKYLENLVDLFEACNKIKMQEIDPERIAMYMSKQELQEDIDEIRYRYTIACKEHPDTLLQMKLKR